MQCCLRIICRPCVKRKAKELLTMPLKMKQQMASINKTRELIYDCPTCQSKHGIKEMLRWPVNAIVDSYLKEMASEHDQSI